MENVIQIFEQIKNTSSLNEKQVIIKRNADNQLFKKCLVFLLDGNVVTGINEKKLGKLLQAKPATLYTFEDVIKYLAKHNTGTDRDIQEIQAFLACAGKNTEFYKAMITKKYRLGADAKLINKCIPGLIPTFNVQLGTSFDKCKLKNNEWISISQKLNGCRCAFIGNKLMTRQGKEYIGLEHIITDLLSMNYQDWFIDGELLYKNEEHLTDSEAFQKGTGIAMSKDSDKSELKFVVFDMFPLEEFWTGKSNDTYKQRMTYLKHLQLNIDYHKCKNVELVERFYEGTDHSQIWNWLDFAEKHDFEGVMINLDTPYECKRTKNLIKVKKFYTYDLQIIDVEEGTGKNKGMLGAFVVEYKNNRVNVGSGYTNEERKIFWENKDRYIGRVIEVKYKEITKDKKTGLESLQFPVYCRMREAGKVVSYN